jgi:hypothetical protein
MEIMTPSSKAAKRGAWQRCVLTFGLAGLAGLAACSPADTAKTSDEKVASTSQAITPGISYTFHVTLPGGSSVVDTTAGSGSTVSIASGANVLGPTAAVGGIEIQPQGTTEALTIGGNVKLDDHSLVNGNIVAGGSIARAPRAKVNGTETSSASGLAPNTTSWTVTTSGASQGPITLQSKATGAPLPGVYDAVVVNAGSSLYLSSGTYFLNSLDVESGANLFIDSQNGPVFVYLGSSIVFRGNEQEANGGVPSLFIGYFGTSQAILEAPYSGVFLAPNATLILQGQGENCSGQGNPNIGTFYGQALVTGQDEVVEPGVFDWLTVPNMPPPPGGFGNHGGINGTGGPGSGATAGGTGPGSATIGTGSLPPPAAWGTVSYRPPGDTNPNHANVPSTTITPGSPVPFYAPPMFDVGGMLANGTVTVTYTSCAGPVVTCTYQGGSSTANPTADLDEEAGRTATLKSCSDGQPASTLRCGTQFTISVVSTSDLPVTVSLPLDARSCETKVDILTPLQTRQMLDSFQYPDPGLKLNLPPNQSSPLVAETMPNGDPALYYGYVYLQSNADLLLLRQMYIHYLTRPLLAQELAASAGQCVVYQNPGDGVGAFVPVVIPGKIYNTIIEMQNTGFQQAQNPQIKAGPPIFKAVILKSTTPLDFQTLKRSGFRYLDYEGSPPPAQSAITEQGGAVAALVDALNWALNAVRDVANFVTDALGALDALFAGKVNYNMTFNVPNLNTGFASSTVTRAWGPGANLPLGASGMRVEFLENLAGLFPVTFSASTDDNGLAALRPAANQSNVMVGYGFCLKLSNDAAEATSFLVANEVCNLHFFVDTALITGAGGGVVNIDDDTPDPSQDRDFTMNLSNAQTIAMFEMTDAERYLTSVTAGGYAARQAKVLVGDTANVIGWFKNPSTAFTMGFHLRNTNEQDVISSLSTYFNDLGYSFSLDAISVLAGSFANTDIVMPDVSVQGFSSREVGTHEYGHFILMNFLRDNSTVALDNLIGDTFTSGQGSNLNYSTRYVNEAFADFISGQVTGIANYHWLPSNQKQAAGDGSSNHVCNERPCFDWNFVSDPGSSTTDNSGIARISTLIHDVFDGQPNEANKTLPQPTNADPWALDTTPYVYSTTSWGDCDGPDLANGLAPACRVGTGPQRAGSSASPCQGPTGGACVASESVALPGMSIVDFGHNLQAVSDSLFTPGQPGGHPYLTDQAVFTALDQTMVNAHVSWCQRCQVLALHASTNSTDTNNAPQLLSMCFNGSSSNPTGDPSLMAWQLPSVTPSTAPDPSLRVDAYTCQTCPPNKFPDPNGQCTVDCPADFVIDGATAPLVTLTEPTTATSLTTDTCPDELVVEVDNPNQLFARGATDFGGSVSVESPSSLSCGQTFTLLYADLPGTNGYVPEQTVTDTGSYQPGSLFSSCGTLPAISFSSAAQLTYGSSPIRFVTPVVSGVDFVLNIDTPVPPPP